MVSSRKVDSLSRVLASREHGLCSAKPSAAVRGLWPRMALETLLTGHRGCVNHVQFNESGTLMASGSDDTRICLWDLQKSTPVLAHPSGHTANIFCVRFMPATGDNQLVSCAGDGQVRSHDLSTGNYTVYRHHTSRVKKLVTEPGNPHLIMSCSEDGTVRQVDEREHGATVLLQLARNGVKLEINSISAPWQKPWLLAVGASDDALRVYDRRMGHKGAAGTRPAIQCVRHITPAGQSSDFMSDCITGVAFADDGRQVLASYLGDFVYLWAIDDNIARRMAQPGTCQPCTGNAASVHGSENISRQRKRQRLSNGDCEEDYRPAARQAAAGTTATKSLAAAEVASSSRAARIATYASLMQGKVGSPGSLQAGVATATAAAGADTAGNVHRAGAAGAAPGAVAAADNASPDAGNHGPAEAAERPRRVLSVDDAVARLEAGDLSIPRQRRGSLASMILNRSQDLFEKGEMEASIRYARAALSLRPNFGMAHYQLAVCYERLEHFEEALDEGEQALQYAWGYDLQQFMRRLRRRIAAAAADTSIAADSTAAAAAGAADSPATAAPVAGSAGFSSVREHWDRQDVDKDDVSRPLAGILPAQTVDTAAAAGAGSEDSHRVADHQCDSSSGNGDSRRSSCRLSHGDACSGGGGGSAAGGGSEGSDWRQSPVHHSMGVYGNTTNSFGPLNASISSSSGGSSSSSSSEDGGPSDMSDSSEAAEYASLDDSSWPSEDGMEGLDEHHSYYDWGGDAAEITAPSSSSAAAAGGSSGSFNHGAPAHHGQTEQPMTAALAGIQEDSDRFEERFLAPLRRQLVVLEAMRQQRMLLCDEQRLRAQLEQQDFQSEQGLCEQQQQLRNQGDQEQQQAGQQAVCHRQGALRQLSEPTGQDTQQQGSQQQTEHQQGQGGQQQQQAPLANSTGAPSATDGLPHNSNSYSRPAGSSDSHNRDSFGRENSFEVDNDSTDSSSTESSNSVVSENNDRSSEEHNDSDPWEEPMIEQDLLTQFDPLILQLGRVLAAGEFGAAQEGSCSRDQCNDNSSPFRMGGIPTHVPALQQQQQCQSLAVGLHALCPAQAGGTSGASGMSAGNSNMASPPAAQCASNGMQAKLGAAGILDGEVGVQDCRLGDAGGAAVAPTRAAGLFSSGKQYRWACRYRGHVNIKTIKDVSFVGLDQCFVAAGSDDGRLYVWDRYSGKLITSLRADRYVVNCVDSHPTQPLMVSCGIDNTIKLWTPCFNRPRTLDAGQLYCMGYNELERAACNAPLVRTPGFVAMCKAFSKERAERLVQQYTAEQQSPATALAQGEWLW